MLLIIGYAIVFISVIAYYKIKNLRNPFTKWEDGNLMLKRMKK